MQTAIEILIWAVGTVTITFFVVIIVAVLKISSEVDDIEWDQNRKEKDEYERSAGGDGEEVRIQGRMSPINDMEQD